MTSTVAERLGWVRAAVGVAMIAAPGPLLRLSTRDQSGGAANLLLRTIGIRDLVLGLGTATAGRSEDLDDLNRWTSITLASDSLDIVASLVAIRSIGRREALGAAGLAGAAVALDVVSRRALHRRIAEGQAADVAGAVA